VRATAVRRRGFTHDLTIRDHALCADEPPEKGGENNGPTPMELLAGALASCTAVTMEMYAQRKGWDVDGIEVEVDCDLDERSGCDSFDVQIRLSKELSEDQVQRLVRVAGKCPVHRALAAESVVTITDHVEAV
jgi:putative redox protein